MVLSVGFNDNVYPTNTLVPLVDLLVQEGISQTQALEGTHLSPSALREVATRVSPSQIAQLYRNAIRLSGDVHFAFHAGEHIHVSTYGLYGFAILSSNSVREACDFALRYHQLVSPLVHVAFGEQAPYAVWSFVPIAHPTVDEALGRFIAELQVSIGISLYRDVIGPHFVPTQVHLPFAKPHDADTYEQMYGCPVRFGHTMSRLLIEQASLEGTPLLGNDMAHREVVELCDRLMEQLRLRTGVAGRVREVLLKSHLAPIGCGTVAQRLGMTERTLRRKLAQENTSFRHLNHELRMQMALQYLRDTSLTVQEIAHAVGFSEDASFRNAFRRWAKIPAVKYRARLQQPPTGTVQPALPTPGNAVTSA